MAEFTDEAKPLVTRKENIFIDPVKAIAGVTNADGEPVAKGYTMIHANEDTIDADIARVERQLADAGKAAGVTVRKLIKTDGLATKVTFWTVKRILKPKKAATPAVAAPVAPTATPAKRGRR